MCCNSKCGFYCIHEQCSKRFDENFASSSGITPVNNKSECMLIRNKNLGPEDVASSSSSIYQPIRIRRSNYDKSNLTQQKELRVKYVNPPQMSKIENYVPKVKNINYPTNVITLGSASVQTSINHRLIPEEFVKVQPQIKTNTMATATVRAITPTTAENSRKIYILKKAKKIQETTQPSSTQDKENLKVDDSMNDLLILTNTSQTLENNRLLIENIRKRNYSNSWQNSGNYQSKQKIPTWSVKSDNVDPFNVLTSPGYSNEKSSGFVCKSSSTIFSPGCTSRDDRSTSAH